LRINILKEKKGKEIKMEKVSRLKLFHLFLAFGLVFIIALGTIQPAKALVINEGGVIKEGEVVNDDVFLTGENVVMDGEVKGILFAFGNTVTVNGSVDGDVICAGSNIVINGQVTGNVFCGGQALDFNGAVSGSLLGAGSSLNLGSNASIGRNAFLASFGLESQPGSKVTRDLYYGGYQAILSGEVGKDLNASSAALELNGKIGGDVKADVESPSADAQPMRYFSWPGMPKKILDPGLRVSKGAEIGGKFTYISPVDQATAIAAAPAGGIVYQTPVPAETKGKTGVTTPAAQVTPVMNVLKWLWARGQEFLTLLVLGALAIWLVPLLTKCVTEQAHAKPWQSLGYGFVTIVVGYMGAIAAAVLIILVGIFFAIITLGGLSSTIFGVGLSGLGLIMAIFTLLVSYGSKLIVSYWVGKLLLQQIAPKANEKMIWPMLVGILLYVLVRSIPFLGWLIGLVVTLMGVGAMWLYFRSTRAPVVQPVAEMPAA
jgi:hypothetical protein